MGGNALKITKTRRYDADEYYELRSNLLDTLFLNRIEYKTIDSYHNKLSFGDMDLIIIGEPNARLIRSMFIPNEVVQNGNVISFDYKELQVDFIFLEDRHVAEFARQYFNYNDLGNLIGRIAHRLGFKFGHNGLWYVLRDPENPVQVIKEVLVTLDFRSAIEFLGFNYDRYVQGFDTLEEIFEYTMSTQYFQPTTYFLSNRNHTARVRDRKRPTYSAAVKYFKEKFGLTGEEEHVRLTPEEKMVELNRAEEQFRAFSLEKERALVEYNVIKRFKKNFNGENYSSWFGVHGKELGQIMATHRRYYEKHNLIPYVGDITKETFKVLALAIQEHEYLE